MARPPRHATPLALFAVLSLLLAAPAAAAPPPEVGPGEQAAPQLILIHGGSFLFADPSFEPLTLDPAIAAGFVPHYLSYPLGDMPGAVRAARAEAIRLRALHGSEVYAYGSSAGGTLAALLAGDGLVSAAVAKAPISDLVDWEWPLVAYGPDYYAGVRLTPEARRRLSPVRRPARRPLLVVQGRGDGVVPPWMNVAFAAKFKRVRLRVVPGGHHTERIRPRVLSGALEWLSRVAEAQGRRGV